MRCQLEIYRNLNSGYLEILNFDENDDVEILSSDTTNNVKLGLKMFFLV